MSRAGGRAAGVALTVVPVRAALLAHVEVTSVSKSSESLSARGLGGDPAAQNFANKLCTPTTWRPHRRMGRSWSGVSCSRCAGSLELRPNHGGAGSSRRRSCDARIEGARAGRP